MFQLHLLFSQRLCYSLLKVATNQRYQAARAVKLIQENEKKEIVNGIELIEIYYL